jgi:hypothetical protein
MAIRDLINTRMNELQYMMENNLHLKDPEGVYDHTMSISKFWSALDEGDRDYITCARVAIEEKRSWNA